MKNTKQSGMYQRSPFFPGKSGSKRGKTKDERSAKMMKIAPDTARPISCEVDRPKTIDTQASERPGGLRQLPAGSGSASSLGSATAGATSPLGRSER